MMTLTQKIEATFAKIQTRSVTHVETLIRDVITAAADGLNSLDFGLDRNSFEERALAIVDELRQIPEFAKFQLCYGVTGGDSWASTGDARIARYRRDDGGKMTHLSDVA